MKLTAETIREATAQAAATGKRIELSDEDHAGLELGISPHGVRTWSLRMRDTTGRLRRFRVGSHDRLTPVAARKMARKLRSQVEEGYDPVAERRIGRAAAAALREGIGTLGWLLDEYERHGEPPKSWFTGAGRRRVERVFRSLLSKPAGTLKASEITLTADRYAGTHGAAENGIRALRPVLSWAARRDLVPASLLTISPEHGVPKRDRALSEDELKVVIPVLQVGRPRHSLVMLFILYTATRLEEAAKATWEEIDFTAATWTIPVSRQKDTRRDKAAKDKRKPLVIPLSLPAVALLQWIKAENPATPVQDFVFAGKCGKALSNWDRAQKAILRNTKTAGWHRQDLRRTAATVLGNLGFPPHVIEATLNHASIHSNLAGRYNQSRYRPEVKEALDALAAFYNTLLRRFRVVADEYGEPELVTYRPPLGSVPVGEQLPDTEVPLGPAPAS